MESAFIRIWNRWTIVTFDSNRLNSGLLIVRQSIHGIFPKKNQFPILVKLHFNLLVDNENIMHFCIKFRIASVLDVDPVILTVDIPKTEEE